MTRRMKISVLTGAVLGVVCIIGASVRSGFSSDGYWLFALWYNRLLMGFVIGLPWPKTTPTKAILRGALTGLIISLAFYSATAFMDPISFVAGILYGMIIEYMAQRDWAEHKTATEY